TVDPASGETNMSNNSDSVTVSLAGPAVDLVANTALDTPDPINVGQVLTYTSNVINTGTATASGVTIEQSVPAGFSLVSQSATNGFTCSPSVTHVDGTGNPGAGADTPLTIKGIVPAPPPATLTSTVTADPSNTIAESNELNNQLTATTTVTGSTCSGCFDPAISAI